MNDASFTWQKVVHVVHGDARNWIGTRAQREQRFLEIWLRTTGEEAPARPVTTLFPTAAEEVRLFTKIA